MLIKLLIASLAILVVLFIALVWLVADLLHISLLLPALFTAFCLLAAACVVLYRKVRASNAAQGLERELAAQAKAQAKLVRPDLQAEVQSMQVEFDKAVGALKSAKDVDLMGLTPPWTPSTPGFSVFKSSSNHFVYISRFDGKNIVTNKTPVDVTQYIK